jgi:PTH1 family peptidyl-tRNA hydrolase
MSAGANFRLIVGLGNPGSEYAETRHNVGFMLLDRMAMRRADWRRERAWNGVCAAVDGVHLLKPETYMNLSGECVGAVAHFYKIPAGQILVVLDDMALGLGRLRFRKEGSAGGHNGLQSILEKFGTRGVPRLRLGIGGAVRGEAVGHVLGKFRKDERPAVEEMLERAEEAIRMAQSDGMERAMNAFH